MSNEGLRDGTRRLDKGSSDLSCGDDRELVERAQRDPREFGALYDRYFDQIYRFAYSRVGQQTAAEDVTSDVFTKALKAMPRYQDTGRPFGAWLHRIAVNTIADRHRSFHQSQPFDELHHISAEPPLDELAANRDEIRRMWALVEALPSQQRTALVLKFHEDLQINDIGLAMGNSSGAVKLLIHRGVRRLRMDAGALRPAE